MACCEAPPKDQVLFCTKNARLGFQVSVLQDFRSQALAFSALSQANQDTSSYKAGIQSYLCQAGIDLATFELEQAEALAYFQRQFALPATAVLVPIDGVPQSLQDQQAMSFLGTPLWRVTVVLDAQVNPVTIGYYRPTVTCQGVRVLCGSGLEHRYASAAILLHELYFVPPPTPSQPQVQVQVQEEEDEVPVPEPFPAWQRRVNPQQATTRQWTIGGPTRLDLPLYVYGRVLLYTECGKLQSEIKVRSEFGILPTFSRPAPATNTPNPDGLTQSNEVGNFGGARLSAASAELSNGEWIGFAQWSFCTTTTFDTLIVAPYTVMGPIGLVQAKTLEIGFPSSLARCAKLVPCPRAQCN